MSSSLINIIHKFWKITSLKPALQKKPLSGLHSCFWGKCSSQSILAISLKYLVKLWQVQCFLMCYDSRYLWQLDCAMKLYLLNFSLLKKKPCCIAISGKLDDQDYSSVPLPRYKCSMIYNCFLNDFPILGSTQEQMYVLPKKY